MHLHPRLPWPHLPAPVPSRPLRKEVCTELLLCQWLLLPPRHRCLPLCCGLERPPLLPALHTRLLGGCLLPTLPVSPEGDV